MSYAKYEITIKRVGEDQFTSIEQMKSIFFGEMVGPACVEWWNIWMTAGGIKDSGKRNKYLDDKCRKYMDEADFEHEALVMEKLIRAAKEILEEVNPW